MRLNILLALCAFLQKNLFVVKALSLLSDFQKSSNNHRFFTQPKRDFALLSTQTNDAARSTTPKIGSVVTVECSLLPEGDFIPEPLFDGIVVDESNKHTLTFILGKGNYLPGLHELVASLEVGQSADASVDAGWGSRNPDLEADISFADLGFDRSQIKVGVELLLSHGVKAKVTKVGDESFTIDANPPLAGASYKAQVKLLKFEDGPSEFGFIAPSTADDVCSKYQIATFALGCFWGGELEFMREPGVVGTKVGYTQGDVESPAYKEVCSGTTGHTEAIMVSFDPSVVSYERLVHLAMDRLGESRYLLNQVGNDKGTQYRHGMYYHDDEQKEIAESIIKSYGEDCVTECFPAKTFWDAEDYHQQYLLKGGQSARKSDTSTIRCYG